MGSNLVLNRLVVGYFHVADAAVAQHVVQAAIGSVVVADMWCTNCFVHFVAVEVEVVAAVIVVVIPIADDSSHLHCLVVDYFALRQIDEYSSKIVATVNDKID